MYSKIYDPFDKEYPNVVKRLSDGACIPKDENNKDYQEFLKWLETQPKKVKEEYNI